MVNISSLDECQTLFHINIYMINIDLMIVYLYYFIEKSKKKGKRKKQLHISYHNGDHYNSVRRISDIKGPNSYHEANKPANIFIDVRYFM